MKKLLGIVFIFVAVMAMTQTIIYRDQATLQWDAVTDVLPEDIVTYEVYIYDSATVINDQLIANLIFVGETAATELLIVFPDRRNWYAGVRTKLVTGEPLTNYSVVAWSYDAGVVGIDGPFVYQPLGGQPSAPENLRDSGM